MPSLIQTNAFRSAPSGPIRTASLCGLGPAPFTQALSVPALRIWAGGGVPVNVRRREMEQAVAASTGFPGGGGGGPLGGGAEHAAVRARAQSETTRRLDMGRRNPWF